MAYLYILLSAACSVLLAHLLKVSESRGYRTLQVLTVNYFFAGVVALLLAFSRSSNSFLHSIMNDPAAIAFCILAGALFIGNFMMYSKSVHTNGVGVTVASMRVSLLVPVFVSILLYGEQIGVTKIIGVALVIGSLILMIPKKKKLSINRMDAGWLLIGIFIVAGFADASLKIYEESFSRQFSELLFMGLIFFAAFLIGTAAIFLRNESFPTKNELLMGSVIGIPNLYSSVFLIYALAEIAGAVVFPLANVLVVIGGTAVGFWYWKDSITQLQWVGLATALTAILLLLL